MALEEMGIYHVIMVAPFLMVIHFSKRVDTQQQSQNSNFLKHGFRSFTPMKANYFSKSRNSEVKDFHSYIRRKEKRLLNFIIEKQQKSVERLSPPKRVSPKKLLSTNIKFIVPTAVSPKM